MITTLLALHIIGGFTSLTSGLVAMLTLKGGKAHRLAGKIYFWGMTVTCFFGLLLSIVKPNPFLFMIAFFSYQSVAVGYRILSLKKIVSTKIKPSYIDWIIGIVPGMVNLGMITCGCVYLFYYKNMFGILGIIFGSIGLSIAVRWLKQFYITPKQKQFWFYAHLQSMGGAYIATSTAFIVVNVTVLPPIVLWLTPTVIGATIISFTTAKYKKKFSKETISN